MAARTVLRSSVQGQGVVRRSQGENLLMKRSHKMPRPKTAAFISTSSVRLATAAGLHSPHP